MWERWDRVAVLDEPVGYLHRTAMNVFRDRRRRLVLGIKRVLRPPAARDELAEVETRSVATDVLASLTPRQRAAIVLTEALDYSADESGGRLQQGVGDQEFLGHGGHVLPVDHDLPHKFGHLPRG